MPVKHTSTKQMVVEGWEVSVVELRRFVESLEDGDVVRVNADAGSIRGDASVTFSVVKEN